MDVFGPRGFLLVAMAIGLAVYINYPPPTQISRHLADWETRSANTKILRGHRIFYKDGIGKKPDGPVLVCLHGFPTSSYDWVKVWPALLEKFGRVIAPDFIGFGFSDKPLGHAYSVREQADLVEELLGHLKVRETHVLAHDYGDSVAQELLARYEDRRETNTRGLIISSLSLLNGGMFPETNFPRITQKALLVPYLGAVLSRLTNIYIFSKGFSEVFGPETQPTDAELADFWALIRRRDGDRVMAKLLQYIPERSANRERWTGVLQRTKVPVQTIYGPADPVNPPGFVDFYKKTVPNPLVSVLHGYIGHYPQWEDPAGCMRAYFDFLKTLKYTKQAKEGSKEGTDGLSAKDTNKSTKGTSGPKTVDKSTQTSSDRSAQSSAANTRAHDSEKTTEAKGGSGPKPTEAKGGAGPKPTEAKGGAGPKPTEAKGGAGPKPTEAKGGAGPKPTEAKGGAGPKPTEAKGGAGPKPTEAKGGASGTGPKSPSGDRKEFVVKSPPQQKPRRPHDHLQVPEDSGFVEMDFKKTDEKKKDKV